MNTRMRARRMSGQIDPKLGVPIWYVTFINIDLVAFRVWADETSARYKFTDDTNRVMFFDETDALLCWMTFR